MPTMMMGSAATFIDCDECWKLLLVTRKGSLYMWDLFNRKCVLRDSVESLITSDPCLSGKGRNWHKHDPGYRLCICHYILDDLSFCCFLFVGTIKVISAKLSKSGSPLVILATRHAFLFDMGLMCWLRVADDCFPASNFASSWNLGSVQNGELASLQVDVRKYMARKPGWSRYVLF